MNKQIFITRKYPFFRELLLPKLATFIMGVPKYSFGSVDVTNRCNLRCKHCYFFADHTEKELSADELVAKIKEITKDGGKVWSCTWVGGEPFLRKEVVHELTHKFKYNLIVTNGTVPLPDWKNVSYYVSVDGTPEVHDQIRGEGCFEKLKKNITDPKHYGKTIRLACCLNRMNVDCIEPMLEEWYSQANIKEIVFDFYTPQGADEDELWIPFKERDRIIDKLIRLKREKYGRFIGATEEMYDMMKEANRRQATGTNCLFMQKGFAMTAKGERKQKCMMGPNADCERCGCIVPFYLKTLSRRHLLKRAINIILG